MTTSDHSLALLLAAIRSSDGRDISASQFDGIDWPALLRLATSHHVLPLVHRALGKLPIVPEEIRHELRAASSSSARRAMFFMSELLALTDLFRSNGIALASFKGPALAHEAYGNLALRQCGDDIDVLIPIEQVSRAKSLLLERGFEQFFPSCSAAEWRFLLAMDEPAESRYLDKNCEYHFVRRRDGLNVDLHWRINPPEMAMPFDEAALFSRLTMINFAGKQIGRVHPADHLLILAFNGAKDCWKRLDRIVDVAAILRIASEDAQKLALASARKAGASRMLLLGAALAQELLGARLSQCLLRAVRADSVIHTLIPAIVGELCMPLDMAEMRWQLDVTLFNMRLRNRMRDRARYIAARLSPTVGDWTALRLPMNLSFLYYPLRPLRLAARAFARQEDETHHFRPRST